MKEPGATEKPGVAELIAQVGDAVFDHTESLEPIATDLAYLYHAISKSEVVQWEEPAPNEGKFTNIVNLFRLAFPPEHPVWEYIEIDSDDSAEPTDTCPECGKCELIGVCSTIVEYEIRNSDGEQDWLRREVYDDTATPNFVRCDSCGAEYTTLKFNENEFLTALSR